MIHGHKNIRSFKYVGDVL